MHNSNPAISPYGLRASAVLLAVILALPLPSRAEEWRSRQAAEQAGLMLVENAARGQLDEAFAQAQTLARGDDDALQTQLATQKDAVASSRSALGEVRSLSTPEDSFFAGCVTRSYLVRHDQGAQRWMLKFRRGAAGWYLSDLNVRTI